MSMLLQRCRPAVESAGDAALLAEIDAALARRRSTNGGPRVYDDIEVGLRIERKIEQHGSMSAYARQLGVSSSFLHEVRHSIRPPSDRILHALGLRRKHDRRRYVDAD
jgi:hypothetical protein